MKIRVLEDRIIVRRLEKREKSTGGIIIPETFQEKSTEAEVVTVGPGRTLENGVLLPMSVKANDRVLLGKYAGTEIIHNNEPLVIIRESDVLGVLEKE